MMLDTFQIVLGHPAVFPVGRIIPEHEKARAQYGIADAPAAMSPTMPPGLALCHLIPDLIPQAVFRCQMAVNGSM
jgi:hypothetical protein